MIALADLNELPAPEFIATLGAIFEHSPWVAERAAASRPFASRVQLLGVMRACVAQATPVEQMALIRAHPKLGARGRTRAELTRASANEQRRAGLDACTGEDFAQLESLNDAYQAKFDMPFILAVRGHDPASIIAAMRRRLDHEPAAEHRTALGQIGLIAGYRLNGVVASPPGAEIVAMNEQLAGVTADALAEVVREWMLAAGLEVYADGAGTLLGRRTDERAGRRRLLLGVHYDVTASALRYDGRLGYLLGLAVSQHLAERGAHLPFEVIIVARPEDDRLGECESLGDSAALRGCIALPKAGGEPRSEDGAFALAALAAAQLGAGCSAIARQGAGLSYRARGTPPAAGAEAVARCGHASRTLTEFLLRAELSFHYDG